MFIPMIKDDYNFRQWWCPISIFIYIYVFLIYQTHTLHFHKVNRHYSHVYHCSLQLHTALSPYTARALTRFNWTGPYLIGDFFFCLFLLVLEYLFLWAPLARCTVMERTLARLAQVRLPLAIFFFSFLFACTYTLHTHTRSRTREAFDARAVLLYFFFSFIKA